ncbi:hypothetical protein CHS0354_000335 [Potamilus streckersoni]|uniref:Aminotransferase class I/classII large domain-containing protein n=1 Tax=Potamilus streckersoni TaxID=2493646 RepID=A0AAE0SEI4_9BIVA|nr:hypothetical protein CHS0354_000335 [Potamilus streckersoni]
MIDQDERTLMHEAASELSPFKLERYFAEYEFSVKYMLSCSDPEPVSMRELLALADDESKELWENLSLGYTESQGHPLLRKEVAKMHEGIREDNVRIITPQEGIFLAMNAFYKYCIRKYNDPRPHVIVTFPGYQSLYENLHSLGCRVDYWKSCWKESGWIFDLEDFRSLLCPNTRIVVVNFPHNPTGFNPSYAQWQEIISICMERGLILFSDEMYRLTNNDGSVPYPSACSLYDNAVTLFGLSKTFGLPGLRIGWLCTRNKALMSEVALLKDYTTMCSSAPSEILAIIAIRNMNYLLERTMSIIRSNLQTADEFFSRHKDIFHWQSPCAGTTTFVPLTDRALEKLGGNATGLANIAREKGKVLIVPACLFDYPDKYFRLGFGRKNLPKVLSLLEDVLNEIFK